MNVLFKQAANIYENNKDFQSGLVVALPKAAVAKEIYGSNAKTDLQVLNFVRLMTTYDPRAAQLVSANLGGPGERWVRKVNSRERKEYIIDSSDDEANVVTRMKKQLAEERAKDYINGFSPCC